MDLPVNEVLPKLIAALERTKVAVLVAPPGSGKTTRVVPALIDSRLGINAAVLLQPRRLAARAVARQIARLRGVQLGGEVGYQVRFERRLGPATRIKVVTDGTLLAWLQRDPSLAGIDLVVLDEFHLRSVEGDLALAMLREVRQVLRPDLRLLVMSATLDAEPVCRFLDHAPLIEAAGRQYPVTVEHLARASDQRPLAEQIGSAVRRACSDVPDGDLLVFLPGVREISAAAQELDRLGLDLEVLQLHGSLPAEQQDRVFAASISRRVILATNVAETSLTVPGVHVVIDSGLVRLLRHDPQRGFDRLTHERVALDAADQRAGRAGRLAAGRAYRLWSKNAEQKMVRQSSAEIARVDLCEAVLQVALWGSRPQDFAWFERPPGPALDGALQLLELLGALDQRGQITERGRAMAKLPLHPRLAALLIEAQVIGIAEQGAQVAALLSERDIIARSSAGPSADLVGDCDVCHRLDLLEGSDRSQVLDRAALAAVRRVSEQLLAWSRQSEQSSSRELRRPAIINSRAGDSKRAARRREDEKIRRLLLCAFPDRVAQRRGPGDQRAVMVGRRGLRLAPSSVVRDAEYFVALRVSGQVDAQVLWASKVDPAQLHGETRSETLFDQQAERVRCVVSSYYRDLCLRSQAQSPDPVLASALLAEAARADPQRAFLPSAAFDALIVRLDLLRQHVAELAVPTLALEQLIDPLCQGRSSFAELRSCDLVAEVIAGLDYPLRVALDQHTPLRLPLPSGATAAIRYSADRPPTLAAQLQQLFGWQQTPTICRGRVKLLVELLAPNRRPVQTTDDLASFWRGAYQDVRKQLRARYPKHAWPEDPLSAPAERRPRRAAKR